MNLRSLALKSTLSICDQALISGSNFVLSLMLARHLHPDQYGLFSILLTVILIASGFHTALVLEPVSVLGPPQMGRDRSAYLSRVFCLHAVLALTLSALVALAAFLFSWSNPGIVRGLFTAAASLPLILSHWLIRRCFYLAGDVRMAVQTSVFYALLLGAVMIGARDVLSPNVGLLAMAAASFLVSVIGIYRLSIQWHPRHWAGLLAEHWAYGKWIVGVTFLYWLSGPFFGPIVAMFNGLSATAELRAADNLLAPLVQIIAALCLFFLPRMSATVASEGLAGLRAATIRLTIGALLIAGAYAGAIALGSTLLFPLFYGKSNYQDARLLLPVLSVAAVIRAATDLGLSQALRAASRPDAAFWGTAGAAVCTLAIGIPLVRTNGALGASWAILLATSIQAIILTISFRRLVRPHEAEVLAAVVKHA